MNINKPMIKDPDETLDYSFDWSDVLESNEVIKTDQVLVPDGLTLQESAKSDAVIVAWISGGTINETYRVTCRITTAMADDASTDLRTYDRSIYLRIEHR